MYILISNRWFSTELFFFEFVLHSRFPIPCLYFSGASAGVCLPCAGSSFLRTGKNLIACETPVPLSNVVEIDKEFMIMRRPGETSRVVAFALFPEIAG